MNKFNSIVKVSELTNIVLKDLQHNGMIIPRSKILLVELLNGQKQILTITPNRFQIANDHNRFKIIKKLHSKNTTLFVNPSFINYLKNIFTHVSKDGLNYNDPDFNYIYRVWKITHVNIAYKHKLYSAQKAYIFEFIDRSKQCIILRPKRLQKAFDCKEIIFKPTQGTKEQVIFEDSDIIEMHWLYKFLRT